jgi:hypothetical protein
MPSRADFLVGRSIYFTRIVPVALLLDGAGSILPVLPFQRNSSSKVRQRCGVLSLLRRRRTVGQPEIRGTLRLLNHYHGPLGSGRPDYDTFVDGSFRICSWIQT